jgi:hypothetical protein
MKLKLLFVLFLMGKSIFIDAQCNFGLSLDDQLIVCSSTELPINLGESMSLDSVNAPYSFYWDCIYSPYPGATLTVDEFFFLDNPTSQFPNLINSIEGDTIVFNLTVTSESGSQCFEAINVVTSCWITLLEPCGSFAIEDGASVTLCSPYTACLPPATYSWSPTDFLNDPTASSPIATPIESTTYCVLITDAFGCTITSCSDVLVGVGVNEQMDNSDFFVYPNPTSSNLTVQLPNNDNWTVRVFNSNGQLVSTEKINGNNRLDLNLQNFTSGLYTVQAMNSAGGVYSEMVVKE